MGNHKNHRMNEKHCLTAMFIVSKAFQINLLRAISFSIPLLCLQSSFQCVNAQLLPYEWGIYNADNPLTNDHPMDFYHGTKNNMPNVGIGTFSLVTNPQILPQTLLHLYSSGGDLRYIQNFPPATLRLQSALFPNYDRSQFRSNSIEFRSGLVNDPAGKEEQIATIQTFELNAPKDMYALYTPTGLAPRGLSIAAQKISMKGTEQDGMLGLMTFLTAQRKTHNFSNEWFPRIGIGTSTPMEHLQLGKKFTFHAGGISRISDNLFYDLNKDISRRIEPGYASAITMYQGSISLGISQTSSNTNEPVTFSWGDDNSHNGLMINQHGMIGIGMKYPEATCDIQTQYDDAFHNALRIRNKQYGNLLNLTTSGNLGIYNANPKERVHIGERLTIHAGGSSVIGDNIYYDNTLKSIQSGRGASLQLHQGRIQLANTAYAQSPNQLMSYEAISGSENTIRGLVIEPLNGYCGIGVSYPKARLQILAQESDTTNPAISIGTLDDDMYFTVKNNGNIGIGTANPEQTLHVKGNVLIGDKWNQSDMCSQENTKLAVDGSIIAKEVLITNDSWADFVFDDDYKLDSLEFIEDFVKINKHLPGIPSGNDVNNNGIEVGEMNALLLQKIEELTLHIIRLHNKQKNMQSMIDILPIQD